jgi:hypothetical protein
MCRLEDAIVLQVYLSTVDYAGQAARLRLHKDGRQLTLTTGRVPASFIDGHGSLVHRCAGLPVFVDPTVRSTFTFARTMKLFHP